MKVSVVIPVFNAAVGIRRCLDSILGQQGPELEVICVDDGSTDAGAAIIAGYAGHDGRVRLLRQPNLGAGPARNHGLDHATGEYVLFFDSDDWCEPGFFSELVGRAEAAQADVVIPAIRLIDGARGQVSGIQLPEGIALNRAYAPAELGDRLFMFSTAASYKLFRRDFVVASGLRFQSLPRKNDVLFVNLALACASRIAVAETAFYDYVYNRAGAIHSRWASSPTAFSDAFSALWRELRHRGRDAALRKALLKRIIAGGRHELDCLRGHRFARLRARLAFYRLLAAVGGAGPVFAEMRGSLARRFCQRGKR